MDATTSKCEDKCSKPSTVNERRDEILHVDPRSVVGRMLSPPGMFKVCVRFADLQY